MVRSSHCTSEDTPICYNFSTDKLIFTGTDPNRPTLVAIKGIVFDVTRNQAYSPSGQYHGKLSYPEYKPISMP